MLDLALLIGGAFVLILLTALFMTPVFLEVMGAKDFIDVNLLFLIVNIGRIFSINVLFWGFK